MSVSLFINTVDGITVNREIPVANQAVFNNVWSTISSANNLPMLKHGEEGHSYDEGHLSGLIEEVKTFIALTKVPETVPDEYKDYVDNRSAYLLAELRKLEGHKVNFFLG